MNEIKKFLELEIPGEGKEFRKRVLVNTDRIESVRMATDEEREQYPDDAYLNGFDICVITLIGGREIVVRDNIRDMKAYLMDGETNTWLK